MIPGPFAGPGPRFRWPAVFAAALLLPAVIVSVIRHHWRECQRWEAEQLGRFQEDLARNSLREFNEAMRRFVGRMEARSLAGYPLDTLDIAQYFETIPELKWIERTEGGAQRRWNHPGHPSVGSGDPAEGLVVLDFPLRRAQGAWRFAWDGGRHFARAGAEGKLFKASFGPLPASAGSPPGFAYRFPLGNMNVTVKFVPAIFSFRRLNHGLYLSLFAIAAALAFAVAAALRIAAARRAAEEAASVKGRFLAHMSHEIRTPLHGILGMAELLADTPLSVKQRRFAESIRVSGRHLLSLVNQVLDFSKLEKGKVEPEAAEFSLPEALEAARFAMAAEAERKGLRMSLRMEPGLPSRVAGDSLRLSQVLFNLLSNAVKFSERGEILLAASLRKREQSRAWVEFEVRDQGPGIPPEERARIFQPFMQSGDASKGGTGLGLAISKGLVSLLGGDIGAEFPEEGGSRFRFSLPFEERTDQGSGEAGSAAGPEIARGSKAKILVVDDHATNLEIAALMLGKLGCDVMTAADGMSALTLAQERAFDLILMDCQMPDWNGFETTALIRALPPPRGRVPIVALTAFALKEETDRCSAAGMSDFLAKPFTQESLGQVVAKWLPDSAGYAGVDRERLRQLKGEDGENLAQLSHLVDTFIATTVEELGALRCLNGEPLFAALHRLRGGCFLMGAQGLGQLLLAMEKDLRAERTREAGDWLERVEGEWSLTAAALRDDPDFASSGSRPVAARASFPSSVSS